MSWPELPPLTPLEQLAWIKASETEVRRHLMEVFAFRADRWVLETPAYRAGAPEDNVERYVWYKRPAQSQLIELVTAELARLGVTGLRPKKLAGVIARKLYATYPDEETFKRPFERAAKEADRQANTHYRSRPTPTAHHAKNRLVR